MGGGAPTTIVAPSERADARFDLGQLLTCDHCDQLLGPSWGADGKRQYRFLCGCRRGSVDAEVVERLVRDRVEAESALLVTGVADAELGQVFKRLFVAVRVAAAADDLAYVWRF